MLSHTLADERDTHADVISSVRNYDTFDLAPTRDGDSLIATFVMFVARLARATTFDVELTETRASLRSAVLRVRLDPSATVAAMHCEVDDALARARADLSETVSDPPLPVGIVLVKRLSDPLPANRMLTLVLAEGGDARWHYDRDAFSHEHIQVLADRFTALLALRATAKWSRAAVKGTPLGLSASGIARSMEIPSALPTDEYAQVEQAV